MEIGTKLRVIRKKKGMTLAELADAIISVSYLSKIENNDNSPNEEVLSLLFEKLEVDPPKELHATTSASIQKWYSHMVHKRMDEASSMYEELSSVIPETEMDHAVPFDIFKIKYYLVKNEIAKAGDVIQEIEAYEKSLTVRNYFYYYRFRALYTYYVQNFRSSLGYIKKAESARPSLILEEWDDADFHYFKGLVNSRVRKTTNCISDVTRALEYYNAIYQYERAAECHILLGISYERIYEYEKAEESYLLADKLAELMDNTYVKGLVRHNLGYLASLQQDREKAIGYYTSSIEYESQSDAEVDYILNTMLCIVMEY